MKEEQFKRGDRVQVRDLGDHSWQLATYIAYVPGIIYPHVVLRSDRMYTQSYRFCEKTESTGIESLEQEVNNLKAIFNASIDHLNSKIQSIKTQIK